MRKNWMISGLLTALLSGALLFCLPLSVRADGWNVYLGQLHSHSGSLDKIDAVGEVYTAAKDAGMDFFAVTDYSHSFDHSEKGSIAAEGSAISPTWAAGKEAANAASSSDFAAIYGYEMAWQRDLRLGHIVTFGTPGWQCRGQEGLETLERYYSALTTVDSAIGMFCHPGEHYGDFRNFGSHRWDYDSHMALVEVSGEDGETFFGAYQTALDLGWHVAPAASGVSHDGNWGASPVRTGILADSLSESSLLAAIRARRVYATLDPGLKIQYSLGGNIMGSRATSLDGFTADFQLSETEGTIEIVTSEGTVVASCSAGETSLTLPSGYPYYYLRLVRDGSVVAVTAPVWVETPTDFGSSDLTASAAVPVQNEEVSLSFTLYNHEKAELILDSIQLTLDGSPIWQDRYTLAPGTEHTFTVPYTHSGVGITAFKLTASGTISGHGVSMEKELTLSYRPKVLNAHILVDGRHSSASLDSLRNLISIAGTADMDVALFREETPEGMHILIVPPLEQDFGETYPQLLGNFVENGGQLILCGQAGNNGRMNSLLAALGSTMSLNNDTAADPVHNGGTPTSLFPDEFNPGHWDNLTDGEYYSHQAGCTVNPGEGTWLVRGKDTMENESRVLLAREQMGEGTVYLAGSFFLNDGHMPLPANQWDPPRANQRLIESLLNIQRQQLAVSDIKTIRSGELGEVYRVKGYVTAGTSQAHNRFPNLLYLQDQTGGIPVTQFEIPDIQVGSRLDITGQLQMDGKNPALKLISCKVIAGELYRFDPDRLFHAASMNYERHGGELMKVEGIVKDIEYTDDGLGVRRFTLIDPLGDPAEILIEDCILSGAYGVNHLAEEVLEGQTTRAYGILHLEDDGTPVLRVRNCDEVVNIPAPPEVPEEDPDAGKDRIPEREESTNPKTGDAFFTFDYFWSTIAQKEGF